MDILVLLEVGVFVALLGCSAFFSSSETSLFSLNAVQLRQMRRERKPGHELVERLLSQPRRLIVTILIGNELVNVAASVISTAVLIQLAGPENSWLNVLIMVPMLLLFGEITPKTLAIRHNVAFACFQARYVELFARAIAPVRNVVRAIADFIITGIVGEEVSRSNIITEDMVRSLARVAVGEGSLDRQEARYIHRIFDFGDKTVRDVMTVRSQIFSLPVSMPFDQMVAELRRTRHTKVPIYEGDKDSVIGILFARDLLALASSRKPSGRDADALRALLREPHFVPESKRAVDLFLTFRKRRLSIALTADEFGGVTGLVTMEDLLERIFGDIPSPSELVKQERVEFEVLGQGRYRLSGLMTIRQFNESIGVELPRTDAATVGGLLLEEFGEMPAAGDRIVIGDLVFTVASVMEQRIRDVLVQVAADVGTRDLAEPPES